MIWSRSRRARLPALRHRTGTGALVLRPAARREPLSPPGKQLAGQAGRREEMTGGLHPKVQQRTKLHSTCTSQRLELCRVDCCSNRGNLSGCCYSHPCPVL